MLVFNIDELYELDCGSEEERCMLWGLIPETLFSGLARQLPIDCCVY